LRFARVEDGSAPVLLGGEQISGGAKSVFIRLIFRRKRQEVT